jgi:purine-binding chemotaxis protein CheW
MAEKSAIAEKQLVVFNLGQESFGVDINKVREIIQLQPVTRVPGTPVSVEGVINLRGKVIPIVDLRKRFHLNQIEKNKETRIVVVACKGAEIGAIVDSVAQVLRIPVDSIEPASSVFAGEHLEHLMGIVKVAGRLVILLEMDQVLTKQEISFLGTLDTKPEKAVREMTTAK